MPAVMSRRTLFAALAVALLVAALGLVAPPGARSNPVSARVTPLALHARKHFVAPPTTADCLVSAGIPCYQPSQLQTAYNLKTLHRHGLDGRGTTIAIVDSFGSPTAKADLHQFDQDFGLPDPPRFDIIQPAGPVPPFDPTDPDMAGWGEETSLDVEWAHAMAPGANILLVETPVAETEGLTGIPRDRQGRELRDQPPPGRRDQPELRGHRGDLPERASLIAASAAPSTTPPGTTSRCSASSGDSGATDARAQRRRATTPTG